MKSITVLVFFCVQSLTQFMWVRGHDELLVLVLCHLTSAERRTSRSTESLLASLTSIRGVQSPEAPTGGREDVS